MHLQPKLCNDLLRLDSAYHCYFEIMRFTAVPGTGLMLRDPDVMVYDPPSLMISWFAIAKWKQITNIRYMSGCEQSDPTQYP